MLATQLHTGAALCGFVEIFLWGGWILFFRLLLKLNDLILPLLEFPTKDPGQTKLISVLEESLLTMAVEFWPCLATSSTDRRR